MRWMVEGEKAMRWLVKKRKEKNSLSFYRFQNEREAGVTGAEYEAGNGERFQTGARRKVGRIEISMILRRDDSDLTSTRASHSCCRPESIPWQLRSFTEM